MDYSHTRSCTWDYCCCSDDVAWGRLLGNNDPAAPGKDWVAAAFGPGEEDED